MTPLLIVAALAQSPSPSPSAGIPRTITVSVVDDKGSALRTLGPQDVAIQENGVARELTSLQLDTRPLTVALVVDTSEAVSSYLRLHVVDAILQFLLRMPEGSRYAIWTTGDRPTKVYDYGDNRAAAARTLRRVVPQGGNTLLDALVEAGRDLKPREDGRAAIVVVTGMGVGFANYDRRHVVDEVAKVPAAVYGVEIDEGGRAPDAFGSDHVTGADYDYVLSSLARATGGARESVLSAMGLERTLAGVAASLTSQYRLSYLGTAERDPKVEVTVALPGVKVRVGSPGRSER